MEATARNIWIFTLLAATCASGRAEASSPELVRPSSDRLLGSLIPPASESMESRLERQAAENVLLQYFGFAKAGFAPYAARDAESLFPLVYDAVQHSLGTSPPRDADIRARLRDLFLSESHRTTLKARVVAVALRALQIPPYLYPYYPAAEAFQRQFAVYYTNQRRRAAAVIQSYRECGFHEAVASYLEDPFEIGAEGRAQLDRYLLPGQLSSLLIDGGLGHLRDWTLDIGAGPWSAAPGHLDHLSFDRSTEDPAVLQARVRQALDSGDLEFQRELVVILLRMIVVEPLWTDVVWEGPELPAIPGHAFESPLYAAEPLPRLTISPAVDLPQPVDFCVVLAANGRSELEAAVDFRDAYLSTRTLVGLSLMRDVVPHAGWNALHRHAADVGASADGALWYVAGTSQLAQPWRDAGIYRRTPKGTFEAQPGLGTRIAVGSHYNIAMVNASEDVFRWTDQGWQQVPGKARDVGIAEDGSFWIIGNRRAYGGYEVFRWSEGGWQQVPGAAVSIDVANDDQAVVTNEFGDIFLYHDEGWVFLGGPAVDVGTDSLGRVWRLNASIGDANGFLPQQAYFFSWFFGFGTEPYWWGEQGGRAARLTVRDNDRIVVANTGGGLFEYVPGP